jgi:ABC-2 type transport system permease protein
MMRATLAIARKELEVYFTTPIAYVMLAVIAFFAAQFANGALDAYRFLALRASAFAPEAAASLNLTDRVVVPLLGSVAVFLVIVAPFLTMRLLAEEKRTRTLELLLTSPIRPISIVLGKYLAVLVVVAAALAVVAIFPAILSLAATGVAGGAGIEWRTVGTGLLGLFLLGMMSTAVGLFFSSLTESVIVSSLLSLVFLLALWAVTLFAIGVEGPGRELAAALSASQRLEGFLEGRVALADVVNYLSFAVLGVYLAERAVEAHRWA